MTQLTISQQPLEHKQLNTIRELGNGRLGETKSKTGDGDFN